MADNTVTAKIGREHYTTELTTTSHHLIADEPKDVGGSNIGPRPTDFLRMSLAACTAMTLRMYADRKEWPVDGIEVHVATEPDGQGTRFNREVIVTGDVSQEQLDKLLEIANACPVHKILTNPIAVDTLLNRGS
ncbi:MAG: OsmC family protein [Bacteroidia bacterium]|nr:OsmC family protein [Bacteroidia bacterium]